MELEVAERRVKVVFFNLTSTIIGEWAKLCNEANRGKKVQEISSFYLLFIEICLKKYIKHEVTLCSHMQGFQRS